MVIKEESLFFNMESELIQQNLLKLSFLHWFVE